MPEIMSGGTKPRPSAFSGIISRRGSYAAAVSWRYPDVAEFRRYVDRCRKSWYLDGPNDVDWILPNEILASREHTLYVDYRRDITERNGDQFWISPYPDSSFLLPYRSSEPIKLVRAIIDVGVPSAPGLRIVADVWRNSKLGDSTTFQTIRCRNRATLEAARRRWSMRSRSAREFR